jgi:hypothetical protein
VSGLDERPFQCRGPVWEFAGLVRFTTARSRRSVQTWFSRPSRRLLRHASVRPSYTFDSPRPPLTLQRSKLDKSRPSSAGPKRYAPSCWREQPRQACAAYEHALQPRPHRGTLARSPTHHCARPDDQQAAQTALTLLMGASFSDKPRHLDTSMPSEGASTPSLPDQRLHHRTVLGCPSISPERVLYALAIDRRHQH